jgi:hypothetical protein
MGDYLGDLNIDGEIILELRVTKLSVKHLAGSICLRIQPVADFFSYGWVIGFHKRGIISFLNKQRKESAEE